MANTAGIEPVFTETKPGVWEPSVYASGPFVGLAGGAVGGLLATVLECHAQEREMGHPISVAVHFLRPSPLATLRTEFETLRAGGRVSILRARLTHADDLLSVATMTFVRPVDTSAVDVPPPTALAPETYPPAPPRLRAEPGPWFMDTFERRLTGEGEFWFRSIRPLTGRRRTPMASVLGPADWTHGLGRPLQPRLADPNIDLSVQLVRPPVGEWIAVSPRTQWTKTGVGRGHGAIFDVEGEIASVSMGVTLLPPRGQP